MKTATTCITRLLFALVFITSYLTVTYATNVSADGHGYLCRYSIQESGNDQIYLWFTETTGACAAQNGGEIVAPDPNDSNLLVQTNAYISDSFDIEPYRTPQPIGAVGIGDGEATPDDPPGSGGESGDDVDLDPANDPQAGENKAGCNIMPENDDDNPCVDIDPDDIDGPEFEVDPQHVDAGICEGSGSTTTDENNGEECDCLGDVVASGNCEIVSALEAGLNILTGAAALAIVGGIMHGGYLYMTGRDNPGQIAAARSKIVWALVALLILLFFWGFLQWLIPGGLLGGGAPTGFS